MYNNEYSQCRVGVFVKRNIILEAKVITTSKYLPIDFLFGRPLRCFLNNSDKLILVFLSVKCYVNMIKLVLVYLVTCTPLLMAIACVLLDTATPPLIPLADQARVKVNIKLTRILFTKDLEDETSEAYYSLKMEVVQTVINIV